MTPPRRLIAAVLVALALWATPVYATWTEVDHKSVQGTGLVNAVSVTGLVGTAANIIAVWVSYYGGDPTASYVTDSQSNSYSILASTAVSGADANLRGVWFYKISPSVSGSMTVTFTPVAGNGHFPSMIVYSLTQGSAPTFNTSVTTGTNSSGTVTPGSIGNANDLVLEGLSWYTTGSNTISGSFSTPVEVAYSSGVAIGATAAWKDIGGSAPVNPNWTTNSSNAIAAQAMAVTGTGGGATPVCQRTLLGVGC